MSFLITFLGQPKEADAIIGIDQLCGAYAKKSEKIKEGVEDEAEQILDNQIPGSDLLSQAVPVVDKSLSETVKRESKKGRETNKRESKKGRETNREINCQDFVKKTVLTALKKRLLDTMVDQTIGWIQGKEFGGTGKPKFVQDFGGALKTAGDEAVGEVIRQSKLANLCQPLQKVSLQIGLQEPAPFSRRISCTLTDVIDNIDDFMDDFSKGGWVGYHELLKPNNNIYGQWLMAAEETNNQIKKKQISLQQEVTVGQGFLGIKRCLEWTFYGNDNYGEPAADTFPVSNSFPHEDPDKPPPIPDGYFGGWKCSKPVITTPGGAIAKGLEKALYSDLDFILTADELSAYLGAIADAVINRAIREGVKGVQNIGKSGSTTNDERVAWERDNFSAETRQAIGDYNETSNTITQGAVENLKKLLDDAKESVNAAKPDIETTQVLNNQLIIVLGDPNPALGLIACQNARGVIIDPNAPVKLTDANARVTTLAQKIIRIPNLISEIDLAKGQINTETVRDQVLNQKISDLTEEADNMQGEAVITKSLVQNLLGKANVDLTQCLVGA